jgi:hypothetical protein
MLPESSNNHNEHRGIVSVTETLYAIASGERPSPPPSLTSVRKATDTAVLILLEQSEELDRRIRTRRERDRRYRERRRQREDDDSRAEHGTPRETCWICGLPVDEDTRFDWPRTHLWCVDVEHVEADR